MKMDEIMTLCIEGEEPDLGWCFLCADNMKESIPLARFLDEKSKLLFLKIYNNALQVAHEKGRLGI